MFARFTLVSVGSDHRARMERLANQVASVYRAEKGFKNVTFLADDQSGEYGYISFWESRKDAEAAGQKIMPHLQEATRGLVKGQPTIRLFEVHEAKG